jgi:excisionase family DNA binding protein
MALPLLFVPPMENHLEPLRFLTLKEAAALLQVSTRTLYRLVQSGDSPAFFKVGGLWRVRASEFAKWIQGINEL